jgi:hypothetical protein
VNFFKSRPMHERIHRELLPKHGNTLRRIAAALMSSS